MSANDLMIFGLDQNVALARGVAERLGLELAPHEARVFSDSEMKLRPLTSVRNQDVYVLGSVAADDRGSVNDALCRLLFMAAVLRDAGAAQVTAVVPYLGYTRKDRRTQPRDPLTLRYVAQLGEALGIARVLSVEVHNEAAFENAFRCQAMHLETSQLFARRLATDLAGVNVTVLSPDEGGIRRAARLRVALDHVLGTRSAVAFMEKHRSADVVTGGGVTGPLEGRTVVIFDDLISTGSTIARAAAEAKERGARQIVAAAAHGIFGAATVKSLGPAPIDRILVSDSLTWDEDVAAALSSKLEVVGLARMLAHAISALHAGGSLTEAAHP